MENFAELHLTMIANLGKLMPEDLLLNMLEKAFKEYKEKKSNKNKHSLIMLMDIFSTKAGTETMSLDDIQERIKKHVAIDKILHGEAK